MTLAVLNNFVSLFDVTETWIGKMASINLKVLTSANEHGKAFKARGIAENGELYDIVIFTDRRNNLTERVVRGEFIKVKGYTLDDGERNLKVMKLNAKSRVNINLLCVFIFASFFLHFYMKCECSSHF